MEAVSHRDPVAESRNIRRRGEEPSDEEEEKRKRRMGRRKTETIIPSNSLSVALREQDAKRIWDILEIRSARITNCAKRSGEGKEGRLRPGGGNRGNGGCWHEKSSHRRQNS